MKVYFFCMIIYINKKILMLQIIFMHALCEEVIKVFYGQKFGQAYLSLTYLYSFHFKSLLRICKILHMSHSQAKVINYTF